MKLSAVTMINGRPLATATILGGRLSSKAETAQISNEHKALLKNLAKSCYDAIEAGIGQHLGAIKVAERSGSNLKVDFLKVNVNSGDIEHLEVKGSLINFIDKQVGKKQIRTARRDTNIGLGSAIKLTVGANKFTTNYNIESDGRISETVMEVEILNSFLKKYSNQKTLRANLIAPSNEKNLAHRKVLNALAANMLQKAMTLGIPVYINKNQTGLVTMKFTRKEILSKAVAKINKETGALEISFSYAYGELNKALEQASKRFQSAITDTGNAQLRLIEKYLENININTSYKLERLSAIVQDLEKELNQQSMAFDIHYVKGSIMAYKGKVGVKADGPFTVDSGVYEGSIIDISELVRGRVRLRMKRGSGTPSPPKIYERTGVFRESINAYVDFRSNIISYYYIPYYDSLEKYGYQISELVEGSIRAVAQQRFNKQFNLQKRN